MPSTRCPDARREPFGAAPPTERNRFERALVFLTAPAVVLGYFVVVTVLRCVVHHRD